MKLTIKLRPFIHVAVYALFTLGLGVALRMALTSYSQALQRPVRDSTPEVVLNNLALIDEEIIDVPNDEADVPDAEMLTVEETIGLAVVPECVCPHLRRRANPQAKTQLWNIIQIDDDGIWEFHMNAYLMLGYIGDDADAKRIVATLNEYTGVLNMASRTRVEAMFAALGQMARRSVATAANSLDEMNHVGYWNGRFQFTPSDKSGIQALVSVAHAKAIADIKHVDEVCENALLEVSDEQRRQILATQFIPNRLRRRFVEMVRLEQRKPTQAERRGLQMSYEQRDARIRATSQSERSMWWKNSDPWNRPKPLPQ